MSPKQLVKSCTGEPILGRSILLDAEDFFTSSPAANLVGQEEGQEQIYLKGARPLLLRAFLSRGIMVETIMKKEEWVSKSNASAFLKIVPASGGMILGLTLMVVGLIISGSSYLDGKNHDHWVLILLISSFVFLGLGAHGFDLLHKAKREEKKRKLNL